jgi:uncharacterized protein YbjT (DUF2867 family)
MSVVLVTGAAGGTQGATGRQVAELLLGQGIAVRAFVRKLDGRAARLRELGAEIVAGDLRDIADVQPALADVDRVFFTYPVTDGLLDATAAMATAARAAGVRRLVEVSQLTPRPGAISPRTRQHWVSEQVFDWADVGAIHLRATVFFENISRMAAGAARSGRLTAPLGHEHSVLPLVSAGDVARVAAVLLADPARPAKPFYRLVGAVPTIGELVAGFGLEYVNIDGQVWREQALAQGIDPHAVEHLSRVFRAFDTAERGDGAALGDKEAFRVTDEIESITGTRPETIREFLAKTSVPTS